MINTDPVLPLARDASSRFLPWLIAFMVWLAAMALAAVMVLSAAGDQWRRSLTGSVTVQIVPTETTDARTMEARVNSALVLLRATPGVKSANAVSADRTAALLEPWLGRNALSESIGLPIPRLIDVSVEPETSNIAVDLGTLAAQLAETVPGASLDDHGQWLDRLIALARAIEAIGFAILIVISLAAIATVVFATRTGLAIHHDVIELLHLIGARDDFVARQFQLNALWLGLKGGATGVVLAVGTLLILGSLAAKVEAGLLPPVTLAIWQWMALGGVAIAAAIISVATARITVLRTIGRMP
ncbi:MAG: cell division protein [Rhodospirillaceae bacterium]|jgi:cell division transport system permease protein|nr:cell division protein [Rhodospirillaceae bacterium]MBT5455317.1 cell division protein [Rhodospirillaceae bacterium]